ncbi:glycosyltransferase [Szabonella alba]|uniref:Glycosyltransferase n=1 Tax=Szabonella alba TaxID=2804194 RepID=A0A8K0Y1I1_9RHOB|nr:glycosyltransferase [Szabonella alba]
MNDPPAAAAPLPSLPLVTVLMAVRDGAGVLPAQLDSIAAQTGIDWRLIAGDDGSADGSPALIARFGADHAPAGAVRVIAGPGQGFVRNFLSLLALPGLTGPDRSGLVALADQDDIWFPDKLARGAARLASLPADRPALYCSRRINWWPASGRRRLSRRYPRPPAFANALVENIALGNTILLNAAALDLARETAGAGRDVPFHDWWLYLLVTGAGGVVIHDPEPGLLYRQHGQNVLGQGEGWQAAIKVRRGVLQGRYATRITANLRALRRIEDRLTPENRHRLDLFEAARAAILPRRIALMGRAGVHRQGFSGCLGFWGAVCLGRV